MKPNPNKTQVIIFHRPNNGTKQSLSAEACEPAGMPPIEPSLESLQGNFVKKAIEQNRPVALNTLRTPLAPHTRKPKRKHKYPPATLLIHFPNPTSDLQDLLEDNPLAIR